MAIMAGYPGRMLESIDFGQMRLLEGVIGKYGTNSQTVTTPYMAPTPHAAIGMQNDYRADQVDNWRGLHESILLVLPDLFSWLLVTHTLLFSRVEQ